jgi:hypothetical protein
MRAFKSGTICLISIAIALLAVGCGGTNASNPTTQGKLVDPSGNWKQSFTDSNGNIFILSALYNQVGPVVSGVNFLETGNRAPGFQCVVQRDISISNGLVANVNQFSGDLAGNFGTIHFTSTLNDAGTHAAGTYTLTPGANGNCLGIALTGTYTGDEVPSMTGNWTGTVTCTANCPTGFTSGTIAASLTQDDATGAVTGNYSIGGVPGMSSGNLVADPLNPNFISGSSMQQKLLDNNGSIFFLSGGPVSGLGTTGLGLDRSFNGNISNGNSFDPLYVVNMSH